MGLFVIFLFFFLVLIGTPIAISLMAPSLLYIIVNNISIGIVAQRVTYALNSFTLLAVPLFIFVGSLLNASGISNKIFDFANKLVGHFSGGLAQVNIIANLIFSGTSGAALADVGGIGRTLIHAMKRNGYKSEYAAAITSASATVGPIFPPSVPFILYSVVAQVSAISLLLAGIIPALLAVAFLVIHTAYISKKKDFPKALSRPSMREIASSFFSALPALLTPFILIFGMLYGYFSPTEAAGVTVFYIIFISTFIYRSFKLRHLIDAVKETVKSASVIMFTISGAALFSWIISIERIPAMFFDTLFSLSDNPIVILLTVNLFILFVGCFLETIASLLILTPLLVPPLVSIGFDPVHLGVMLVFNLMIGLLTPPMGMSVYLSSEIAEVPVHRVIREVVPYYLPLLLTLIIITYFPAVILWIPNLMR